MDCILYKIIYSNMNVNPKIKQQENHKVNE